MSLKKTFGFTLIEVLVAVGIMLLIAGVSGLYLNTLYGAKRAENAANQIISLLVTAQEKSASQEADSRWAVYFNGVAGGIQTYTLYRVDEGLLNDSPPFSPENILRQVSLPSGVRFTTPAANQSVTIIFERMTGRPSVASTVRLVDDRAPNNPKTVTVSSTGIIESSDL